MFVHGGVSGVARAALPPLSHALADALGAATALDAVERAVMALEDDPELNAGYGSVLDRAGGLDLDAGIADGSTGRAAGVAHVTVRHPISLARKVLEETPHVLLTGSGAMEFAAGMERIEDTTPAQRARWEEARSRGHLALDRYGKPEHVDTVGAVALDAGGRLAAGSSTGGVFGMMPGRVGDSPIFGAGMYASEVVAVVGTGVGELFLESLACFRVAAGVLDGLDPQAACEMVIADLGQRSPLPAGLLALGRDGALGAAFRGGSWAVEGPDGPVDPLRMP
ncbi:MAG: isoaspartyl peptidase/L-asparaginase [Actinomycetota bacterium]